jgi:fermentation-respiration switch protein FrsA (DUF1100 family)
MVLLVSTVVAAYALLALGLYVGQRRLIYPARGSGAVPALTGATLETLTASDGSAVHALYARASEGAPTLVHFHGNGEELADLTALVDVFRRRGLGVLAVEYPGYGLSKKSEPSETAIYDTAEVALRDLRENKRVSPASTVLSGQSLGSGVAVEMARRGRGARVVLYSPYTSIAGVANVYFPFLPNRLLVKDAFDNERKAASVAVPVLVVHGTDDEIIPFELGRELSARFPRARLLRIEGGRHNDLFARGGAALVDELARFCHGE